MAAERKHEHRLDLVLEGGGVKGIGLAGAYSVLEEHDFEPQNIAGTSAGAITAALIAARYSAKELRDVVLRRDEREVQVAGGRESPGAFAQGAGLGRPVRRSGAGAHATLG